MGGLLPFPRTGCVPNAACHFIMLFPGDYSGNGRMCNVGFRW